MDKKPPRVANAPGLAWKSRRHGWEARWQARYDLVKRGYTPKSVSVWRGDDPDATAQAMISDQCQRLQTEMLIWGRGGLPIIQPFDGTIGSLVNCYQTDPDSTYQKLRYHSRKNADSLMRRISAAYGGKLVKDINARALIAWHAEWKGDGRVAMAHGFVGRMRTLFGFGMTMLEDDECARLCAVLNKMRFPVSKPRSERLTAGQATAIRGKARARGLNSVALAQAFQFDLMLRQKDVIGEWLPMSEKGTSDVIHARFDIKWLRGLRWSEIDQNMIICHNTSKREKDLVVDLRLAPMVMEELFLMTDAIPVSRSDLPASGPVIVSETTGRPWSAPQFRKAWRRIADEAGVPKSVKNMDSRAGGITEATDAGAELEHVRHAATHGDISMTQRYSRGSVEKIANVMQLRARHRSKNGND